MPYTVEITLADLPSSENGLPIYPLPETFDTLADAKEAAADHIAKLGRPPSTVMFTVMDRDGVTVATGDNGAT
ncbi:hypothetical protein [Methylobacterium sp. R2-1]|uniref:hypothetical protein n=1 Tax=Methylobacterium sp. R2-1 TaxID=2587064 RepID=UPI00160AFF06|nr:hypothetical protein [Methylobacterium sp. R2-1]MBB2965127.1 hypothetical protein [Methylobacterium sp. R2-1]